MGSIGRSTRTNRPIIAGAGGGRFLVANFVELLNKKHGWVQGQGCLIGITQYMVSLKKMGENITAKPGMDNVWHRKYKFKLYVLTKETRPV